VADSGYAKHEDPRGHTLVTKLARLVNALGMKARPSVANTKRPRVGTIISLAPMSEGLAEEASVSLVSHRAEKREKCRCSPRLSE
jgi:hypothetical protein